VENKKVRHGGSSQEHNKQRSVFNSKGLQFIPLKNGGAKGGGDPERLQKVQVVCSRQNMMTMTRAKDTQARSSAHSKMIWH